MNRLKRVHEYTGNTSIDWQQEYLYDRWGNRTIDQNTSHTFGAAIPKPDFTVNTGNNRLGVPGGQSGAMTYDSSGNLTTDTYSAAAVTRVYDAENRMTSETQASSYVAGTYSYDGDGRRVKRVVGGVETWQVYGIGGELLAEYAANAAYATPQKEYGYRNGQLLVTATITSGWGSAPTLHDNPLVVGETTLQARHITELRTAIDALRTHMSMSAYSWQYSVTTSDWITANPILAQVQVFRADLFQREREREIFLVWYSRPKSLRRYPDGRGVTDQVVHFYSHRAHAGGQIVG